MTSVHMSPGPRSGRLPIGALRPGVAHAVWLELDDTVLVEERGLLCRPRISIDAAVAAADGVTGDVETRLRAAQQADEGAEPTLVAA
jgi:hypothetical protein